MSRREHTTPGCRDCGGRGILFIETGREDANLPEEVFGEDQDARYFPYDSECTCVMTSRGYEIIPPEAW